MLKQRILIVEDDPALAAFYQNVLEAAGYQTGSVPTGAKALAEASCFNPDLVILDVWLEGEMTGFDVLSALRQQSNEVPVMILTGQLGEDKMVRGLNLGADTYVLKPVSKDHLVARVRAQLRRGVTGTLTGPTGIYQYGELVIDLGQSLVMRGETRFTFGDSEVRVLARLLQTPGQPVTYQELLQAGWGNQLTSQRQEDVRILLNCIYRLRSKLEPKREPDRRRQPLIKNVWSKGFLIGAPSANPSMPEKNV